MGTVSKIAEIVLFSQVQRP